MTYHALKYLLAFMAFSGAAASSALASETLTFDDIAIPPNDAGSASIPTQYGGLDWSDFGWGILNPAEFDSAEGFPSSGYANGVVSCCNVLFGDSGAAPGSAQASTIISSPSPAGFDLTSGFFTAAWNNGLSITANAQLEDGTVISKTFLASTTAPIEVIFDWSDVASVYFTSSGGVNAGYRGNPGILGTGTEFAIDNLMVTTAPVPLPADAWMMLGGIGGLGLFLRRRRQVI